MEDFFYLQKVLVFRFGFSSARPALGEGWAGEEREGGVRRQDRAMNRVYDVLLVLAPELAHGFATVASTDRFREEVPDRQNFELAEFFSDSRDSVRDDEPLDPTFLNLDGSSAGEHRVGAARGDREGAFFHEEVRAFDQRATACDFVVEHEAVLAFHLANDALWHGLVIVAVASLVDHRHRKSQALSERTGLLGMPGVGRHHDVILEILCLPVVRHDTDGA